MNKLSKDQKRKKILDKRDKLKRKKDVIRDNKLIEKAMEAIMNKNSILGEEAEEDGK